MKLIFLFSLSFFFTGVVYSQAKADSIILLNGKVFRGDITKITPDFIHYQDKDRKGMDVSAQMESYRVFSYTQKGVNKVLYTQDESINNFLSIEDARAATLGSYDARKTFKPRIPFWTGVAIGYGASLFDTYLPDAVVNDPDYQGSQTSGGFFKSNPSYAPVIVPLILTVGWSFPSFKIKSKQIIQKDLINNESYYRGFHRIARQKRMFGALVGGVVGIGAGMLTYAFANL